MDIISSIAFSEAGSGCPVLVIHGWEMTRQVEELDFEPIFISTPGLRRIYVDLPGMGASPANGIQNLDDIFHRLVQFIDSQIGAGRFLLVGSSCGAFLAHALALRYSEQVDGVMLRVPLVEPITELRDLDAIEPLVQNEQVMFEISTETRALLGEVLVQTPYYIEAIKLKYKKAYQPALEAADKDVLGPIRSDPERYRLSVIGKQSEQAAVLAPTLIACGRQDNDVGYRDALSLLPRYPRSTFVVLDRAQHDLPVDDNGVFAALVVDWVKRVEEWRNVRES